MIDLKIYDTVPGLGYDPLSHDNMSAYKSKIRSSDDKKAIGENMQSVCEEIAKAEHVILKLMLARENQFSFMRGNFL